MLLCVVCDLLVLFIYIEQKEAFSPSVLSYTSVIHILLKDIGSNKNNY